MLADAPLKPEGCSNDVGLELLQALKKEGPSPCAGAPPEPTGSDPAEADSVPSSVEQVRAWSYAAKGNLRVLLSTLHTLHLPGGTTKWQPVGLSQLLGERPLKRAYNRALLATHPDHLAESSRMAGQEAVDALVRAHRHMLGEQI